MNCMAYKAEERFSYVNPVLALKQFLLEKKRKLNSDINTRVIPTSNVSKARGYIRLLEELLKSEYFIGANLNLKVFKLMERLKNEDAMFKEKISELESKIVNMEAYLETADEFTISDSFNIPDECDAQSDAVSKRRQEYKWEIEAVRDELNGYNYRLKLCRDLKGIICRPNGFFNSIYKV